MTEPGDDCPRCGARLAESGCLKCYWQPVRAAQPGADAPPKRTTCARCGDDSPNTTEFHPSRDAAGNPTGDTPHPDDDGVRLCPSCWIPALRRRAERDPISAEERDGMRKTLYAALDAIGARVRVRPARVKEAGEVGDLVDRSMKAQQELERYQRHLEAQSRESARVSA